MGIDPLSTCFFVKIILFVFFVFFSEHPLNYSLNHFQLFLSKQSKIHAGAFSSFPEYHPRKSRETISSRRNRLIAHHPPDSQRKGRWLRNPKAQQKPRTHKPFGSDHPKQGTPKWGRMRKNNRTNCGHWTTSSAECPTETESLSVE